MTPDDYQAMNDILIAQASENEIYIAGLLERIRDLDARVVFQAEQLEKNKLHIERLQATLIVMGQNSPYVPKWD